MSQFRVSTHILRPAALVLLGILLFVFGSVVTVYSPWFQDELRQAVVAMMNRRPGTDFRLAKFRLWFPLRVEMDGLSWVQKGDTMVVAGNFDGNVAPFPILEGRIDVSKARLVHGAYYLGTVDSATMIRINADTVVLHKASVKLSPMNIRLDDGLLAGGSVDLYINPDPPAKADTATSTTPLDIAVRHLSVRRLSYRMNLLPTIDSLGVSIASGSLDNAAISLTGQTVDVRSFTGHGLRAAYIVPDSATIADTKVAPPSTTESAPWTVRVGKVAFDRSSGLYTTRGYKPAPGLDFGYIAADRMTLSVDSFYNRATTVRIPLALTGTERCGVTLSADGRLDIDEKGLTFNSFTITTANGTSLKANGYMGMGDLVSDPSLPLRLYARGSVAAADGKLMFPVFSPYLAPLSAGASLDALVAAEGTSGRLDIRNIALNLPGIASLRGSGTLNDVMNPGRLAGDVVMNGTLGNVSPWVRMFVPDGMLKVPPMTLSADLAFSAGSYSGSLDARTRNGNISLDGDLHGRGNIYTASLDARNFPVDAFMPSLGIGTISGTVTADGRGFDLTSPQTATKTDLHIDAIEYRGSVYRDISGTVSLSNGHGDMDITSGNPGLAFSIKGSADTDGKTFTVNADADISDLDMYRMKITAGQANMNGTARLQANFDKTFTNVAATMRIDALTLSDPLKSFTVDDVTAHLNASDSVTNASVRNRDLYMYFSSPNGLRGLTADFARVTPVLDGLMKTHSISVTALQQALPQFNLAIDGGSDNAVTQILRASKINLKSLSLTASNDSLIHINGNVLGVRAPAYNIDTLTLAINQSGDRLDIRGNIENRPGTFDNWAHVSLNGFFDNNRLGVRLHQRNIAGATGFDIGGNITLDGDSTATLRLDPLTPTIGYKPWTINDGNFITYNFIHSHIDADLHMQGEGSRLAIYSEHAHETDSALHGADEPIIVDIAGVKIQDWVTINPFAPPMRGDLGANMKINWHDRTLTGNGDITLTDFYYGKERVGDIRTDLNLLTNATGLITADIGLWVDGVQSVTLKGALNDSTRTTPFNMDLRMIHFPLATANPFMPGVARLKGYLNGSMDVSGDASAPHLDGWLAFDSASVKVDMLGTTFTLPDTKVPVDSNRVHLNNFAITACNDRPVTANGTVDIVSLTNPEIELTLHADSTQIVKSTRAPKGALVYGRAFLDLDADVSGNLTLLNVNARANILPGTNVTYIMADASSVIESQAQGDMVKFVNFADSAAVAGADSIIPPEGTLFNLNATLTVSNGTTVNVDLGTGTSDRVQLKSDGQVSYTMSPLNSGRMTGRLNINSGFVRFTPPMMSQKNFTFNEGSYVAFNGDMMNPTLNIHATDRLRANVTQTGQNSRLINFDILLGVTGTLSNMNVAFDLATDDDATVANELATMSPSQRASAAMNMLITNIYSAGDTKADASMGGNALYSFLTSQLNSWAANTIKGVDLSFGINQYDNVRGGTSSQATSYSYRVSKSLFNDRFKIIVGGNYSTDANADENLSQNLVNDISFEYLLNPQGTMIIRIFRHTGYESILEGEITQTGVGFAYKRKISSLRDLLPWIRRRDKRDTDAVNDKEILDRDSARFEKTDSGFFRVNIPSDTTNDY